MLRAVRMIVARVLAAFFALTWLVLPGFGLIDLSVTWDTDWHVVLEAGWGVFMTVLVGGSFLAATVAPYRTAPAEAVLLVGLATCTTPSSEHWPWRCRRSPCWPRRRRFLGIAAGLSAGYLGLVSFAFPATWAGLPPLGSALCLAWGAAVAVLAVAAPRLQPRELRREVVETQ
jgi:hypothetical protein